MLAYVIKNENLVLLNTRFILFLLQGINSECESCLRTGICCMEILVYTFNYLVRVFLGGTVEKHDELSHIHLAEGVACSKTVEEYALKAAYLCGCLIIVG